jgi:hypothetical protein
MNAHSTPTEQERFETARQFQEYYQESLREVGVRIPAPLLGQSVREYRQGTLDALQQALLQNHPLGKVEVRELRNDALKEYEPLIVQACVNERTNPANVPVGQLKPIKVLDQYGRVQMTKFIGQESFVKSLGRAGRRVVNFFADGRVYDAMKGSWR